MWVTNTKFIEDLIAHILADPLQRIPTPEDIQRIVDEVRPPFPSLSIFSLISCCPNSERDAESPQCANHEAKYLPSEPTSTANQCINYPFY